MKNNLITRKNERVKNFFESLDRMLDNIEALTQNYRPMLGGERFMTDAEVSERLKLSRRVLQDYRNDGLIPYCKLGGKVLYRESDIQKLLDEGYKEAWR